MVFFLKINIDQTFNCSLKTKKNIRDSNKKRIKIKIPTNKKQ